MEPLHATLESFMNIMPAVFYQYLQNPDGTSELLYISPTSLNILGRSPEYFMENMERFWGIVHADDVERLKNEDEKSLSDNLFTSKVRIILPSGEVRWIRLRSESTSCTIEGSVVWNGCVVDITNLEKAEEEIRKLRKILPLCSFCKKIRNKEGEWQAVDSYIYNYYSTDISHSVCPECMKIHYPDECD